MALKVGQKVWIYDHFSRNIKEGTLHSTEDMSECEEQPTLVVKIPHVGICNVLEAWVFNTKEEADKHEEEAEKKWAKRTVGLAVALGVYAFLSIYLHKLPWVKLENTYQTVQFAISKILIFAVISYMLYLSTKNYLAHKHNAVVNRHRQNALMTYTNIADAASEASNRDVILTHAAGCIFSPQPTGYSGEQSGEGASAKTVVELLSTTMKGDG